MDIEAYYRFSCILIPSNGYATEEVHKARCVIVIEKTCLEYIPFVLREYAASHLECPKFKLRKHFVNCDFGRIGETESIVRFENKLDLLVGEGRAEECAMQEWACRGIQVMMPRSPTPKKCVSHAQTQRLVRLQALTYLLLQCGVKRIVSYQTGMKEGDVLPIDCD